MSKSPLQEAAEFTRAITRPFGVLLILIISGIMVTEGKTPPGWFVPFIVLASEWFIERPIVHWRERNDLKEEPKVITVITDTK